MNNIRFHKHLVKRTNYSSTMEIITHIDQVLPLIGELGLFQILYIAILCIITIPASFQTLIIYFVAHNPPWRCHVNSTVCTFTDEEITSSKSSLYNKRCQMARSEWEFVESDLYSIVTQVSVTIDINFQHIAKIVSE